MSKSILVLRYRFIGDTILTVPFLRNLRYAEPDAYIAWVVAPISSEVVYGIPYVDELIYWDPETIHADSRGTHKNLRSKIEFIKMLRAKKFDKVYVLKRSLSSAIMAFLTGAKQRIGFDTEGRGFLLTKKVKYDHNRHEVQNFLNVLSADGVAIKDDYLEAWLTEEEVLFGKKYFEEHNLGERVVAIHPFAANSKRAWHIDNFISVSNKLREEGYQSIFFGGLRDKNFKDYLKANVPADTCLAIGELKLRETMAVLKRCKLLICNDSGIMHIAAALGVPIIAIFGPQSPVKFGPYSSNKAVVIYKSFPCSPCKQKFFKECEPTDLMIPKCIAKVTADEVIEKSLEVLDEI